jgi:hypothetical protein
MLVTGRVVRRQLQAPAANGNLRSFTSATWAKTGASCIERGPLTSAFLCPAAGMDEHGDGKASRGPGLGPHGGGPRPVKIRLIWNAAYCGGTKVGAGPVLPGRKTLLGLPGGT